MPRGCGCTDRCSCIIRAGSGAAVSGNGRPETPYVVSLDGGGSGGGGGFDSGDVKWTARQTAPVGWLIADGAAVSRSTYPDLFTAIGTAYGDGDGTSTFNLPDLTGRFLLGADGAHSQGSTGGSESLTLSVEQIPSHSHTTQSAGTHEHNAYHNDTDGVTATVYRDGAVSGRVKDTSLTDPAGAHTHTINPTGGGQPVTIMPPYATALPLIKT